MGRVPCQTQWKVFPCWMLCIPSLIPQVKGKRGVGRVLFETLCTAFTVTRVWPSVEANPYRIVQARSDHLRSSGPTPLLRWGQDCVQLGFEYLHQLNGISHSVKTTTTTTTNITRLSLGLILNCAAFKQMQPQENWLSKKKKSPKSPLKLLSKPITGRKMQPHIHIEQAGDERWLQKVQNHFIRLPEEND